MTLSTFLAIYCFVVGACVASFLNVVIWRVPRGESLIRPPSHCPKCNARIRWYQNVPIISWLALRGRCANCREPISPRYILVETLGGLLFFAAYWRYLAPYLGPMVSGPFNLACAAVLLQSAVIGVWIALMIVGSFVDFDLQLLPDFVTVGGMVLGVAYHATVSAMLCLQAEHPAFRWFDYPVSQSLLGLVFGFGLLWLVRWVGSLAFRREAMGMGDVFLMGAIGAIFGPVAVVFTLIVSSVAGSVVGLGMMAASKAKLGKFVEIPFGPYLCIGCLGWMFAGSEAVRWYLHAFMH